MTVLGSLTKWQACCNAIGLSGVDVNDGQSSSISSHVQLMTRLSLHAALLSGVASWKCSHTQKESTRDVDIIEVSMRFSHFFTFQKDSNFKLPCRSWLCPSIPCAAFCSSETTSGLRTSTW